MGIAIGVVALLALAGGTANIGSESPTPETVEPTPQPVHNQTTVDYLDGGSDLGPNEEPVRVTVTNNGNQSERVDVRIKRERELAFNRTYDLQSGTGVTGLIDIEDSYTVTVHTDSQTEIVEIPQRTFDCNDKSATVSVDGPVLNSESQTTLAACQGHPLEEFRDFLERVFD